MGQKIHPLGFRLNITQTHRSQWFSQPKQYSARLQEDFFIRKYLQKVLHDASLSRINLIRGPERILVELHVGQPKLVTGEQGIRLKELTQGIQKELQELNKLREIAEQSSPIAASKAGGESRLRLGSAATSSISLQIIQVSQPATDARLVAKKVAEQLEKRVAFRRVMKQSVQAAREAGIDGIKIQIAGRLNGAEIARTEWIREGRVPLHTLQADIDYCSLGAQTIYGTLGIKVWLFKK
jgi:small subunit ribosomal protein S3